MGSVGNTRHLPGAKMLLVPMNCAFVISLSSKIHCHVKNRNGLYLNRYRSNCKSVGSLLRASPKLVRKQGKVYMSSKHKRRGYSGGGEVSK